MRTKKGIITSTKMKGTVTVTVHRLVFHPVYKKRYRKSKNFLCDVNGLDLYLGDTVSIAECRPLSKRKYYKVTEILKAAPRVSDVKEDAEVESVLHREKKGADADAKKEKEKGERREEKESASQPEQEPALQSPKDDEGFSPADEQEDEDSKESEESKESKEKANEANPTDK